DGADLADHGLQLRHLGIRDHHAGRPRQSVRRHHRCVRARRGRNLRSGPRRLQLPFPARLRHFYPGHDPAARRLVRQVAGRALMSKVWSPRTLLASAATLAFMASLPLWGDDPAIGVGINLLVWVALSASWILFSGLTGYISLGHTVFYGIGGYVTALLWLSVP